MEVKIVNKQNTLRYFESLRRHNFYDLWKYNVFPNAKEFTESMGAYKSMCAMLFDYDLNYLLGNKNVHCFVVGDGNSPRTGLVFAKGTTWNVHSFDPRMRMKWIANSTHQQLKSYSCNDQEFIRQHLPQILDQSNEETVFVVVAVHSHADFNVTWNSLPPKNRKVGLAVPCCVKQKVDGLKPCWSVKDMAIHSEKNIVNCWMWNFELLQKQKRHTNKRAAEIVL